jgi:alpha-tubulin suppressor-like RCC1 family protein
VVTLGGVLALALALVGSAQAAAATSTSLRAWGWGHNTYGELGIGSNVGRECPVHGYRCVYFPVALHVPTGVTAVDGGLSDGVALMADGTVMSWGTAGNGALGNGTEFGSFPAPTTVAGVSGVTAISAGSGSTLALLGNGTVMAWGLDRYGQLGDGTTHNKDVPVPVSALESVTAVSAGNEHNLALLANGHVMAWGHNADGQLGNGGTSDSDVPVEVPGLSGVVAISAGGWDDGEQSLALLANGHVMAWGSGEYGQLGDGSTSDSDVPVEVTGLSGVRAIAAGGKHSLALLNDGTVMAWGWNTRGALGDGTTTGPQLCGDEQEACSRSPVRVQGLSNVIAIDAAAFVSIALRADHTVATWGWNGYAEIGNGYNGLTSDVPVYLSYLGEIAAISAGFEEAFVLHAPPEAPEFGRCVEVGPGVEAGTGLGEYDGGACTTTGGPGLYEWYPGVMRPGLAISSEGAIKLQSSSGWSMACSTASAGGEYAGARTLTGIRLRLQGCRSRKNRCSSRRAAKGEVVTTSLVAALGIERLSPEGPVANRVALDLAPADAEAAFAVFRCGGRRVSVSGSVIAPVATNAAYSSPGLAFEAAEGRQLPEQFEGGPRDVLEASFGRRPPIQVGLQLRLVLLGAEPVEVNSVA